MSEEARDKEAWELTSLGRAVGSLLAGLSPEPEQAVAEALGDALARRVGEGGSHLTAEESRELALDHDLSTLKVVGDKEGPEPLVLLPGGSLYLRRYFEYETIVQEAIAGRIGQRFPIGATSGLKQLLAGQVNEGQRRAVVCSLSRGFTMISGGPGTGKTRVIVLALALFLAENPELKVALAAPTGKAAFRMHESAVNTLDELELPEDERKLVLAQTKASTIHRLLGAKRDSVYFKHDRENPLPHDVVIIDEASMVDLPLMAKLLAAIRPETKLILLGDEDQLSPVQGGAVYNGLARDFEPNRFSPADQHALKALCSFDGCEEAAPSDLLAGCYHRLSENYRFSKDSSIYRLCQAIRGHDPDDVLGILRERTVSITVELTDSCADDLNRAVLTISDREGNSVHMATLESGPSDTSRVELQVEQTFSVSVSGGSGVSWKILDGQEILASGAATEEAVTFFTEPSVRWAEDSDAAVVEQAVLDGFGPLRAAANPADAIAAYGKFRILCAINRGHSSVDAWNRRAVQLLPAGEKAGAPVVVTTNDYSVDLFNGDDGIVMDRRGYFLGEDDQREVAVSRLPSHLPGYAISIHRSQGSEYDEVVVFLPPSASRVLSRELLYVAVSRARKKVLVVGSEESIRAAISNPDPSPGTGVPDLLKYLLLKT